MEKWKAKYASHFPTPSTATRYFQNSLRYTNTPTGTKDRAIQYTTNRLRRWFCKKHKQTGRGFTHYPDEYLYQKLGLIRLPMLPQNLPWAKA